MAITKSVAATNAACNAITSLVDQGSLFSSGRLKLLSSDSTLIAALPLSNPAFRDATDGTAIAYAITDATAIISRYASRFSMTNRDGTSVYDGTVTTTGGIGDLTLNSINIIADSTITISAASFIVPR